MSEVIVRTVAADGLAVDAQIGAHRIRFDEPAAVGGTDSGAEPPDMLLASVGACEAITLKMYAARKGWALRYVNVRLSGATVAGVYVIRRHLELDGDLDAAQRSRLREIAGRCPVHRILDSDVRVEDVEDIVAAS